MRALAILVLALATTGCALGLGTARVGSWSPRTEVDYQACLMPGQPAAAAPVVAAPGADPYPDQCTKHREVDKEIPGRKFWGIVAHFPSLGYGSVDYQGESYGAARYGLSAEYLRGRGRLAWGVRASFIGESEPGPGPDPVTGELPPDDGRGLGAAELALMGHYAPIERISLYGGLGYLPYASTRDFSSSRGYRAFGGMQLPLGKAHGETPLVLLFEIDRLTIPLGTTYRSTGVTTLLGLFF